MQQQAIPYRVNMPRGAQEETLAPPVRIPEALRTNSVVVVGRRSCCMVHVLKRLLLVYGVIPTVCETGSESEEREIGSLIAEEYGGHRIGGDKEEEVEFPVVFIGGKLVGGLERVMAMHISSELVSKLKHAGAI